MLGIYLTCSLVVGILIIVTDVLEELFRINKLHKGDREETVRLGLVDVEMPDPEYPVFYKQEDVDFFKLHNAEGALMNWRNDD